MYAVCVWKLNLFAYVPSSSAVTKGTYHKNLCKSYDTVRLAEARLADDALFTKV